MKELKSLFKYIYKRRYYIALFLVAFIVFFRVSFPDEKVVESIFDSIKAQTGISIEADSPKFSFIPSLGIKFDSAKLRLQGSTKDILLGRTKIGISPLSVLMLSPALKVESESFRGEVQIKISGFSLIGTPVDELYLKVYAVDVQLRDILYPQYSLDLFAKANLNLEGYINLRNIVYSDLTAELLLDDLRSKEGTNVGFFAIPPFSVKKGEASVSLQKSELTVGKFVLGGAGDDIDGSLRGKWSYKGNRYEFTVKLKLGGELERSFGSFMSFLPQAAKKPDGFYNFRINGDGRMPVPNITPL